MAIEEQRLRNLLERLEAQWVRQGSDTARALRAGLTDGEIDALMAPTGIRLPDELRIWWRWHDGTEPAECVGPAWEYRSLSTALEYYDAWLRAMDHPMFPSIPAMAEAYWHRTWFPIATPGDMGPTLYVETAGIGPGDPAPVRMLDPRQWDDYLKDRVSSFTDLVQMWVDALDGGYYWWADDEYGGGWYDRFADLPLELRLSGVL